MLAYCSNCCAAVFAELALRLVGPVAVELDDPAGTFDDAG
jgi:hypothetical protein